MPQTPQLSNLINHTLSGLSPIQTIMKMAEPRNIQQLGLNPEQVISFGGGWCNHKAPTTLQQIYQHITKDIKQFHQSGRYSTILGDYKCREQLSRYENQIYNMKNISPANVSLGQSSTQLFHDIIRTLINPTDNISVLDPTYANYFNAIKIGLPGTTIQNIPALQPSDWTYLKEPQKSLEILKKHCKNGTKILVIPIPDNPTSQIPSDDFIKSCYEILKEHNSYLILDFAYKTLYFNTKPKCYSWSPETMPNLVTLHSNSKWLSSLGRRLGWV